MKYSLFFCFFWLSITLAAQSYRFDNYSNQDGLAQSQANTILQDYQGYLWIGTVGGLSKFDSHQFHNYYKKDGLLDNNITALFEDPTGHLWVGTKGGISRKEGASFIAYPFPKEISNYKILHINPYNENILIIATNGAGLILFDMETGSFTFDHENKFYVRKVYPYENNFLLATTEGVFSVDNNMDSLLHPYQRLFLPNLKDISITDIEWHNDSLWISTFKKGVYLLNNNNLTKFTADDGLIKNGIRDIAIGSDGKIWFASNSGVGCFQKNKFTTLTEKNGLANSNIKYLYSDKNGSIWLASKGQGIYRFSGWLFTTLTKRDNLPSDVIMTINEYKNKIWFGSFDNGVAYMDAKDSIIRIAGIRKEYVWSSLKTRSGDLWFGTTNGIVTYNEEEIHQLKEEGIFNGIRITALIQDDNGVIWIGHKDGFSSYDGHQFQHPTIGLQLPIKRVRSLVKEGDKLWIGCKNGLFLYDNHVISTYNESHGLADNSVNSLALDKNNRLWIGTINGLNVLDRGKIKTIAFSSRENDPVNFLHVYNDQLFIGANNGLHIMPIKEDVPDRPMVYHFGLKSGLPGMECNLNAIFQPNNKDIYFGTNSGLVKLDLKIIANIQQSPPPDVHITGLRIFMLNKDLSNFSEGTDAENHLPRNLQLDPKDNHITFDFTGINYASPENVKYKYRLIGADSDWLPATQSNFVTYSYLPHGKYTFEIKGSNNTHNWSVPQQYTFSIKTPYYLSFWFIALCGLILLSMVWGIYRWRKSVVQKKNETELLLIRSKLMDLEQQSLNSSMNRHFIFNALNSIQYYINREDKRSANTYLTNFAKLIRKNLDSTQKDWTTLSDELERIELYLNMEHMRFKNRFEYKINVSQDIDVNLVEIPPMLFQPFLENSIWHGILPKETKGKILLDIRRVEDQVKISISDNGIGIHQSKTNKLGQMNHQSKGVDIINDRIKLFSKMTDKDFQIIGPNDVFDENQNCIGTKVEILMPIVQGVT